ILANYVGQPYEPDATDEGSVFKINMLLRRLPKLKATRYGATACRNIVAKYPGARVILVSGSPKEIAGSGALALLLKPIKLDQLYAALYDAAQPPVSEG
ncbi:MAG: hypothetical protein LC627_04210, partial [Verrucomicrobiaceae bacterium]|nr:hypothetical protein [Verrucomicrobiaceae bacterium]